MRRIAESAISSGLLLRSSRKDARMAQSLRRSTTNRTIAGVCGGIAEFFGIDPTVCRVVYVLLCVMGWRAGLIAYLVLWVVIPQRGYR